MTTAGTLPIPPNLSPATCGPASQPDAASALTTMSAVRILQVAHTPDPDDAFAWFALAERRLGLKKFQLEITTPHIDLINERCIHEGFYDVAAISSAAYPFMQENYRILSAGASVGRGYGPAFVTSKSTLGGMTASEVIKREIFKDWTIAIPGEHTTAAALIKMFYPAAEYVCRPCDLIPAEVASGQFHAGVLIHEDLMNWSRMGLVKIDCMGDRWARETGLPIPVGLNVIHRRHSLDDAREINQLIRWSMEQALNKNQQATEYAYQFSNDPKSGEVDEYIHRFANEDTLALTEVCLDALRRFWKKTCELGISPEVSGFEVVVD